MSFLSFADWIATAPGWIASAPEWLQQLCFQIYQAFIYKDRWTFFANGLRTTFIVTLGALILGVILGLLVGMIRSTHDTHRGRPPFWLRFLNMLCSIYLTVIRGTPMMVQLMIMGFVIMIPKGETQTIWCAILTFGINSGAYVAETARSGIMSISTGQMEAGRSLGFTYGQTMRYIILPQAIKNILPALGNEMITLLKDTSLVTVIALTDVTKAAQIIVSNTYSATVPYIGLAVIYLVIVMILSRLLGLLERRLRVGDKR